MSTSGISTLDTSSDATQSKGEASPSSDTGSSDGQQKDEGEKSKDSIADEAKDNDRDTGEDEKSERGEDTSIDNKANTQVVEGECTDLSVENTLQKEVQELTKDQGFEDDQPGVAVGRSGETAEGTVKEEPDQITDIQKSRHISSSDSSSDGDKLGETLTITAGGDSPGMFKDWVINGSCTGISRVLSFSICFVTKIRQ